MLLTSCSYFGLNYLTLGEGSVNYRKYQFYFNSIYVKLERKKNNCRGMIEKCEVETTHRPCYLEGDGCGNGIEHKEESKCKVKYMHVYI